MRVLSAIMALMVGFTPVSFAKDETGESPSNRGERGNSSRVEAERGELGSKGELRDSAKSEREDYDEPGAVKNASPRSTDTEVPPDDASDGPRVKAGTAPVPVRSLGIDPALAPTATPGPKAREAKTRKVRISKIGASASAAAKARKARSEEILRADKVPLNLKLPTIADAEQSIERTHRQVVGRTLAILTTAVKGEGLDQATVDALIVDFGAREFLSPEEAAFIAQPNPPTMDRVQFAWRYEAAWAMLWALSAVDELKPPRTIVDVRAIAEIVRGENVETLIEKTTLRPMDEILDQADLIYRYRWALVDAQIHDRELPAGLDPGVALERHRALNWLIGYLGQEWDEVTPDT